MRINYNNLKVHGDFVKIVHLFIYFSSMNEGLNPTYRWNGPSRLDNTFWASLTYLYIKRHRLFAIFDGEWRQKNGRLHL